MTLQIYNQAIFSKKWGNRWLVGGFLLVQPKSDHKSKNGQILQITHKKKLQYKKKLSQGIKS